MRFKLFLFFIPFILFAKTGYFEPWGKDTRLLKNKQKTEEYKNSLFIKAADQVIKFHQNILSPVDGPRSHFRPTSSRYMQLAMQRYGFFKGLIMGLDRLLRENDEPWLYRTIVIDQVKYKYDPAVSNKYKKF